MNNSDMPANPITDKSGHLKQVSDHVDYKSRMCGLTKREAFAMAAMQGWLARCANVPHTHKLEPESVASVAVSMADALLKELEE